MEADIVSLIRLHGFVFLSLVFHSPTDVSTLETRIGDAKLRQAGCKLRALIAW